MQVEGLTPDVLWLASAKWKLSSLWDQFKNWISGLFADAHFFSQFLEETIEVGLICLDEYSPVSHDSDSVVASTKGPFKRRSQFHAGELIEGAAERREENGYGSTELSCHSCSSLEILPL